MICSYLPVVWTVGFPMSTKRLESFVYAPWSVTGNAPKKNDALEDHVYFCRPWGLFGQNFKVLFSRWKKTSRQFFLWWLWHPQGYPILWGMGCFDHQILGIFGRETWILREIISNLHSETSKRWLRSKINLLSRWLGSKIYPNLDVPKKLWNA